MRYLYTYDLFSEEVNSYGKYPLKAQEGKTKGFKIIIQCEGKRMEINEKSKPVFIERIENGVTISTEQFPPSILIKCMPYLSKGVIEECGEFYPLEGNVYPKFSK